MGLALWIGLKDVCAQPVMSSTKTRVSAESDRASERSNALPWLAFFASLITLVMAGCGGSARPLVSAIQFPNGTITAVAPGGVVAMSANITRDVKGLGVDWSVICTPPQTTGGAPVPAPACGSFSPTHTASGGFTNYTAPFAIPTGGVVTITATSTEDPTRTSSINLTVAGAGLSVSITPSSANVEVNSQALFTATVANDPANLGVNWTLTCGTQGGPDCGQLLQTQSPSGTPVTYVAPANIPASLVTLIATSVTNPTATAQAIITVVPAIGVSFFTPPPATLAPGASANLIAVVSNDFGNGGVTWSATAGTFSLMQTASGAATVYTAPSDAPAGTAVTITATSLTDPTRTISATISIVFNISVGISSAVTSIHAGGTASFTATVLNDGANAGVRWTATAGTFNPAQSASGVATLYTAPGAAPAGGTVVITATSVTDPTKSATTTVTIGAASLSISIAPPTTTVQAGATASFIATVTGDSSNGGVTWSASGGTLAPAQTASGVATVFTAPSTVPSGGTVTITATSVADTSVTATATVTISLTAPPISVSISPSTASLQPGGTQSFTAIVANDTANGGVTWSATAGTFNPTQTASGAATVFTAPGTAPAGGKVTITATSVTDTTQTATAMVTVGTVNAAGLLSGQYAFSMSGQNSAGGGLDVGSQSYLGSITADGSGNITAGEVDLNSAALTNGSENITGITGTYSLNAQGVGTITLTSNAQGFALNLSVAIVKAGHGLIMSTSDDPNNGVLNGTLDLQTPGNFATPLNGNYAFTFSLPDTGGEEPDELGGVLTISAGTINNYLEDENASGFVETTSTAASDTFGPPDANGRGIVILNTFGAQSGLPFVYYVVDSTHILLATTQGGGGLGAAYLQPATQPASLAGSYAFTGTGYNAGGGSINQFTDIGGVFTCDATGNLASGTLDVNSNGAFTTGAITGTCALDSPADGRGTITIASGSTGGVASFAVYPISNNTLLMVGLDPATANSGTAYTQAAGVSASSLTGSYGASFFTAGINGPGATSLLGTVMAGGTTALTGTVDINDFVEEAATSGATLTGTGSLTDTGNGRLTGEFTTSPTTANAITLDLKQVFYIVDGNTVLSLESDGSPGVGILQLLSAGSQ